jgi:transposase
MLEAFEKDSSEQDFEGEKQQLYAKIGQLEVERDWLKKISKQWGLSK